MDRNQHSIVTVTQGTLKLRRENNGHHAMLIPHCNCKDTISDIAHSFPQIYQVLDYNIYIINGMRICACETLVEDSH